MALEACKYRIVWYKGRRRYSMETPENRSRRWAIVCRCSRGSTISVVDADTTEEASAQWATSETRKQIVDRGILHTGVILVSESSEKMRGDFISFMKQAKIPPGSWNTFYVNFLVAIESATKPVTEADIPPIEQSRWGKGPKQ